MVLPSRTKYCIYFINGDRLLTSLSSLEIFFHPSIRSCTDENSTNPIPSRSLVYTPWFLEGKNTDALLFGLALYRSSTM